MKSTTDGTTPDAGRVIGILARGHHGRLQPADELAIGADDPVTLLRSDVGDIVGLGGFDSDDQHDRDAVVAVHLAAAKP